MENATSVFEKEYQNSQSIEIGIAELRRKGFSQINAIIVLIEVFKVNVVEADKLLLNSLAWSN